MDEQIAIALAFAKDQKQKVLNTRKKRQQAQHQQDEFKMIDQYQSSSVQNSNRQTKKDNQQRAPLPNSITDEEYYKRNLKIIHDDVYCGANNSSENDILLEYNLPDIDNILSTDESIDDDDDDNDDDAIRAQSLLPVPIERPLHYFTNISTNEYCRSLARLLRDSNICKSHSNRLISLIKSILPQPNYMPSSANELYTLMNVENLFTRRKVCITCKLELSYNENICAQCQSIDQKTIATIFDVDLNKVLSILLQRLSIFIEEYRKERLNNDTSEKINDIIFNKLYNQLAIK